MPLDVGAVQQALHEQGLDGWLWYDFQGANPIAQRHGGPGRRRAHGVATLVLPDSRRRASPAGWCTPSSGTISTACRAARRRMRAGPSWSRGSRTCWPGTGASPWSIRPTGRFLMSRASMPAPSSWCAARACDVVSSGDLVQQFEAHWSAEAIAVAPPSGRKAVSDQGSGVRRRRRRGCATACRQRSSRFSS